MKSRLSALVTMLVASAPALAKVEITEVQASYGPYGPERPSLDVYPHDEVFFRFHIAGAKTDDDGKVDGELTIQLHNAEGKPVFNQNGKVQRQLQLGGDSFVSQAYITIGPK